jgi:hypothetical protein
MTVTYITADTLQTRYRNQGREHAAFLKRPLVVEEPVLGGARESPGKPGQRIVYISAEISDCVGSL